MDNFRSSGESEKISINNEEEKRGGFETDYLIPFTEYTTKNTHIQNLYCVKLKIH